VANEIRLTDVRRAWEARDPEVVRLICALAEQPDDKLSGAPETPAREGAPTIDRFIAEIRTKAFHKRPAEEQRHYRVETIRALEAAGAEVRLPDRLRLHEVILEMWADGGPFARECLLEIVGSVKLTYGPWRAIKRIYKDAEERGDAEMFGAIVARVDASLGESRGAQDVGRLTLGYVARRGWRWLRRTGLTLPAAYPDFACDVLSRYPEGTPWHTTWVANHIVYHEDGKYGRGQFHYGWRGLPGSLTKHRAFAEAWQRTPRPLFSLLERARADRVREFAVAALKADFRTSLREVEPQWVARLVGVGSAVVDEFVVWILGNVPRFEQGAFRQIGLHNTVLRLFDSPSESAAGYAAEYARTHARDLPLQRLIRLANNPHESVRKLAADLLGSRDPRTDVGLEAWGKLLETEYGYELAAAAIKKHFGPKELTPAWFRDRFFTRSDEAFEFVSTLLLQTHPRQKLGTVYFAELIERVDDPAEQDVDRVVDFAMGELERFDLDALDPEFLKRLLVHPLTQAKALDWIDQGKLKVKALPAEFFKTLAYHPMWEADPWLAELRAGGKKWARSLNFDESVADRVLGWMRDVRSFAPSALGFEWLMQLVARSEGRYHDFAVEVMTKAFVPADFAPNVEVQTAKPRFDELTAGQAAKQTADVTVDLKGATFVFTGKLSTMTRSQAEAKVTGANGVNYDAVSSKLHYLVIGDEGSPLYGNGKKGSKQVKAEGINAAGGNIKIISETAFLKMLAGEQQEASADATAAGLARLWEMATTPGGVEAPVAAFARKYIRRHHPEIALAATDRPVDPGAEVPASFLTFVRVKPLLTDSRKVVREFALELARWEFARWAPPVEEIIALSEAPFAEVRRFVAQALLVDDSPEHRRYRIDPNVLTPAAVYRFVESVDEATRDLGMELIRRQPRLRLPESLFRLTESPDRKVRAFVVRELRALYRERGITEGWRPAMPPPPPTTGATARRAIMKSVATPGSNGRGEGAPPRPAEMPAGAEALRQMLRRGLFEISPGRLPPSKLGDGESRTAEDDAKSGKSQLMLKPLPARRAKLALVETIRDLATGDEGFARVVLPVLEEFMASRGASEQAAALVAVTRIRHAHPELAGATATDTEVGR
jgi:hypothetical protein